ncbi:GxxExxY protein [Candidatus Uhrbacteria bacterium]|nr:GxxExxY protein [Candidatus Uhrbacteria bacterium]
MGKSPLLYQDITYKVRGACFDVWKQFGGAFKEAVVDRALTVAMEKRGLQVEDQVTIDVYYGGRKVGTYRPDKIVNKAVLVEVKCKPFILYQDKRQFWLYLQGSQYKVGLLINFGSQKLEIVRRVYDKARSKNQRLSASSSA